RTTCPRLRSTRPAGESRVSPGFSTPPASETGRRGTDARASRDAVSDAVTRALVNARREAYHTSDALGRALSESDRPPTRGISPSDVRRSRRRGRVLPALDRDPPDGRGAHLPRLDVQLPGQPRRRDRGVQGGDRRRSGVRQSL